MSGSERSAGILPAQRAQDARLSFAIAISGTHFALARSGGQACPRSLDLRSKYATEGSEQR